MGILSEVAASAAYEEASAVVWEAWKSEEDETFKKKLAQLARTIQKMGRY